MLEGPAVFPLAFLAGILSFLSPCVLPLVPGYISYMAGLSGADVDDSIRRRAVIAAAFFVAGFTAIFVPLGATASVLGSYQNPGKGALLLLVYSLGLGIPFILAGIGVTRLTGVVSAIRNHTRPLMMASGALLMVMGVLFMTNSLFRMSIWIQRSFDALGLDFLARI